MNTTVRHNKHWTKSEERQLSSLLKLGYGLDTISHKLGRTSNAIKFKMYTKKLKNSNRKWTNVNTHTATYTHAFPIEKHQKNLMDVFQETINAARKMGLKININISGE